MALSSRERGIPCSPFRRPVTSAGEHTARSATPWQTLFFSMLGPQTWSTAGVSVPQESVDLGAPILRQGQHSEQSLQTVQTGVQTGVLDTERSKIVQAALQPRTGAMTKMRAPLLVAPMAVSFLAVAHEAPQKAVAQEGSKTTDKNSDI